MTRTFSTAAEIARAKSVSTTTVSNWRNHQQPPFPPGPPWDEADIDSFLTWIRSPAAPTAKPTTAAKRPKALSHVAALRTLTDLFAEVLATIDDVSTREQLATAYSTAVRDLHQSIKATGTGETVSMERFCEAVIGWAEHERDSKRLLDMLMRADRLDYVAVRFIARAFGSLGTLFSKAVENLVEKDRPAASQEWAAAVADLQQQFNALMDAIENAAPVTDGLNDSKFRELLAQLDQSIERDGIEIDETHRPIHNLIAKGGPPPLPENTAIDALLSKVQQ